MAGQPNEPVFFSELVDDQAKIHVSGTQGVCDWCNARAIRWCDFCSKGTPLCSLHDCPVEQRMPGMCKDCYCQKTPERLLLSRRCDPINTRELNILLKDARGPGP